MISREEAKQLLINDEDRELEYSEIVKHGDNVIDKIYDSIGTCEQCEHYRGGLCFLSATYNYEAPMKDSDDMCKGFERRQND